MLLGRWVQDSGCSLSALVQSVDWMGHKNCAFGRESAGKPGAFPAPGMGLIGQAQHAFGNDIHLNFIRAAVDCDRA